MNVVSLLVALVLFVGMLALLALAIEPKQSVALMHPKE